MWPGNSPASDKCAHGAGWLPLPAPPMGLSPLLLALDNKVPLPLLLPLPLLPLACRGASDCRCSFSVRAPRTKPPLSSAAPVSTSAPTGTTTGFPSVPGAACAPCNCACCSWAMGPRAAGGACAADDAAAAPPPLPPLLVLCRRAPRGAKGSETAAAVRLASLASQERAMWEPYELVETPGPSKQRRDFPRCLKRADVCTSLGKMWTAGVAWQGPMPGSSAAAPNAIESLRAATAPDGLSARQCQGWTHLQQPCRGALSKHALSILGDCADEGLFHAARHAAAVPHTMHKASMYRLSRPCKVLHSRGEGASR